MVRLFTVFFLLSLIFTSSLSALSHEIYNVIDYDIKNDGSELATLKIKSLIELASKNGGGTLYFPAGEYITGPVRLESNITIHIESGAIIRFSDNFDDYLPMVKSRWEGVDIMNFSPLFYAYKAENITITGRGIIDGQGKKWWDFHRQLYNEPAGYKSAWQLEFQKQNIGMAMPDNPNMFERGFCRPPFIQPMYCKNVLIEGIKIINSPFWTVNPEFCENVTITGITIKNPESPNTDGINPESCKNVHISNCHISVGDDCITIKSGRDEPGRKIASPAENYTITNCTMLKGHGGVVIGSEMSGDVRNIVISNCVFDGTDRGIRIKSTRGRGGVVENISVSNIVVRNILKEAITLNLMYTKTVVEPLSERTPQFKNIHFSNISGDAKQAITIIGLEEEPVQNITFSGIYLETTTGILISRADDLSFHHITILNKSGPSILISDSRNIEIDGFRNILPLEKEIVIQLLNVENAYIHSCFQIMPVETFISIDGASTKGITISENNRIKAKNIVMKSDNVPTEEIIGLK